MGSSRNRKASAAASRSKRDAEAKEISKISATIESQKPPKGLNPLSFDSSSKSADEAGFAAARKFEELPLSFKTLSALKKAGFTDLTEIQRATLPHSLCGRDIMGGARTGSGKTLAFIIPMLECLFKEQFSHLDGLGGLVIVPTRELAMQIFDVLRVAGKFHSFSAGVIIGGKPLEEEQGVIAQMNILVATPGRLLQHLDETPGFDAANLRILVIDEADRCLDMGFSKTIKAILKALPARQTMLFSATLSRNVRLLSQLAVRDAEYLSIHESDARVTPSQLTNLYMVIPVEQKMDVLWSFIKTHLKSKTIVFLSSCKQVKFMLEAYSRMRPGVVLMGIHGKIKQAKRMAIYYDFAKRTEAVLFATDLAARGLDFPAVDWVVQMDCPEDQATYIHRVGRTARMGGNGKALMLLSPWETKFLELLKDAKIELRKTAPNPDRKFNIASRLSALCSQDTEFKFIAQKALVSYIRSVHLMGNKEVFDVTKLPVDTMAQSMGLAGAPQIKFHSKAVKKLKNMPYSSRDGAEGSSSRMADELAGGHAVADEQPAKAKTKLDKLFAKRNQDVLSETFAKLRSDEMDGKDASLLATNGDDDEDFMTVKRLILPDDLEDSSATNPTEGVSKKSLRKIKKDQVKGNKVLFDDDGMVVDRFARVADTVEEAPDASALKQHLDQLRQNVSQRDKEDRRVQKEKLKEKRMVDKAKRRAQQAGDTVETDMGVQLALSGDEHFSSEEEDNSELNSSSESADEAGQLHAGDKRKKRGFQCSRGSRLGRCCASHFEAQSQALAVKFDLVCLARYISSLHWMERSSKFSLRFSIAITQVFCGCHTLNGLTFTQFDAQWINSANNQVLLGFDHVFQVQ